MRRIFTFALAIMLLIIPAAYAGDTYSIAGFDPSSIGHVWENNLFFTRMAERTGITFVYQQSTEVEQWQKAKDSMFKSGNLPDALFKADLTVDETMRYYASGQLIDLRPYITEENAPNLTRLLAEHPEWLQTISLPDGAIVALPTINEMHPNNAMWINKNWLDTLGLAVPTTADELTNVLRAFKQKDANSNGNLNDEIPLSAIGMWDLRYLGHAFGMYANDYYMYRQADGTVATILTTEQNRAFLTWLHTLWSEGLIDPNAFINNDNNRMVTDAEAAMQMGMFFAPTPLTLVTPSHGEQYTALEPLVYGGAQVYRNTLGSIARGAFAITSACSNPAALVSWVDYLYSEEGSRLTQAGLEGVEYTMNSDGTWSWIATTEEVTSYVIPNCTIADGGQLPGLVSTEFQLAFDHAESHRMLNELAAVYEHQVLPMPVVYLSAEAQQQIDAVHLPIMRYAEAAMARFVTGDIPLNDDTWAAFCQEVDALGINTLISLWQEAIR